jgi:hypothetical protein
VKHWEFCVGHTGAALFLVRLKGQKAEMFEPFEPNFRVWKPKMGFLSRRFGSKAIALDPVSVGYQSGPCQSFAVGPCLMPFRGDDSSKMSGRFFDWQEIFPLGNLQNPSKTGQIPL